MKDYNGNGVIMRALIVVFFTSIIVSTLSFGGAVELTEKRVPIVREYIEKLKKKGLQPKLIIGATSTETSTTTAGEEWVLANNAIEDEGNPRNMYMDFLQKGSMEVIAKAFPDTFAAITFDFDVLGYMKWNKENPGYQAFGRDGVDTIYKMLARGGKFYMPRNTYTYPDEDSTIHTLQDFITQQGDAIKSPNFLFEVLPVSDMLDTSSGRNLTTIEREGRAKIGEQIAEYAIEHNTKRIIADVFGKNNVELKKATNLVIGGRPLIPYLLIATKRAL